MELKIVEAGHPIDDKRPLGGNWGKFGVARYTDEWSEKAEFPGCDDFPNIPLLRQLGWTHEHVWILDLQTGEGAMFRPGGFAAADLHKRRVWVCPLFEPFLTWLYTHVRTGHDWYRRLPRTVELPDAEFQLRGYRRVGWCGEVKEHTRHEYFDDPPILRRTCPGTVADTDDDPGF